MTEQRAEIERDRVLGCLLGGAIGDALGAAVEFLTWSQIQARHGDGGLVDYGVAFGRRGAITDDTQLTLFVAEGLIRAHAARRIRGSTDPLDEVQLAHQRWLHTQGVAWSAAAGPVADAHPRPDGWLVEQRPLHSARAPGVTCLDALRGFGAGRSRGTPEHRLNDSKGCGGVMRVAAAALWSPEPAEVFTIAAQIAALTHGHPSGYLSAGAFAVLLRLVLEGAKLDEAAGAALAELAGRAGAEETVRALEGALRLAARGPVGPVELESLGGGWTGEEALAIALCAAVAARGDFDAAVRSAVNHSGDSDSTGSICGQLMGAQVGAAAIDRRWRQDLELTDVLTAMARDLSDEFSAYPPTSPQFAERYPVPRD